MENIRGSRKQEETYQCDKSLQRIGDNILHADLYVTMSTVRYALFVLTRGVTMSHMFCLKKYIYDHKDEGELPSRGINSEVYIGPSVYTKLSILAKRGLVERNPNTFEISPKGRQVISEEIESAKAQFVKNAQEIPRGDAAELYNGMLMLYRSACPEGDNPPISDLVFRAWNIAENFINILFGGNDQLTQTLAMQYVLTLRPMTDMELHRFIPHKSVQNIKLQMQHLEKNGCVEFEKAPNGKKLIRVPRISVTEHGREVYEERLRASNRAVNEIRAKFEKDYGAGDGSTRFAVLVKGLQILSKYGAGMIRRVGMGDPSAPSVERSTSRKSKMRTM